MAGTNPMSIVYYIGYASVDSTFVYYPHDGCKKILTEPGTEIVVLNDKKINDYKKVMINGIVCWAKEDKILKHKPTYKEYFVSENGKKAYMDWECITVTSSDQYKLQTQAYTDSHTGIRMVNGRYCIAIGQFFCTKIGTKIDLITDDGNIIRCILGDCKANCDTNITNMYAHDGSVSEFIVNTSSLLPKSRNTGDVSYSSDELSSRIVRVIVYEESKNE